ncbi:cytochrome P450 [Pleomassaria siparia CBS 279.74]|uniref:Cytochrome P450 n=1 Tax=Pleomassaria siparia CBS 279.74 TaxID=1314801 RepID=A0A6G1KMZ1_9PLEO|nr:cytochrome P450 [Pleomassaria siparia CBS 279.74]
MSDLLVVSALVVAAVWLTFSFLLHATQDSREPQPLGTSIPFFGPILGVIKHQVRYLRELRDQYQLPICTLRLPFSRIYVVNNPELIQAVHRQSNALSFSPIGRDFGFLFSGLTQASQKTLKKAYDGDGNGFTRIIHQFLKDGHGLELATRSAINELVQTVPKWTSPHVPVDLFDTVRHALTIALTNTVYGPNNPFLDPQVEAAWLKFLPGISHLMYSPLPYITARRNLQAREKVVAAFVKYFKNDHHLQGSQMIQDMYEANMAHGLQMDECAKMEIATCLALLSSGSLTAIWTILHILSDVTILEAVRQEILDNITKKDIQDKHTTLTVDLGSLKSDCPILMAVLQETLRYHSTVMSVKAVEKDMILSKTYLLKKNSVLMIPGPVVHHDANVWGPDADWFNHHRFLDTKKTVNTASYRPFGSGATMCPGRHFSTNVILALVTMMMLQFDVHPVENQGEWVLPTTKGADLWNAMPKLDHDVKVTITPREEMENVDMKFVWDN